ncbi:MAG: isoleucine--tRNA ligase [Dehalococcoidia bacterium]|jgi:isoleucyl-tRNA synthetase|nr:isoleucine--tRNA ligase [Dehalococcoidia bacterium]
MFKTVDAKARFPDVELEILRFWKENAVFQKSIEARRGQPYYTFNDGPPTTNGAPGIHHVLSRIFKDIPCRYKTMRGFYAPRKAGWDTHGLPVELEVEHSLGLTSKKQIEDYGVAEFNQRCKESVFKYIHLWEAMVERIGHWIDLDDPYVTLKDDYIESEWWAIKQLWDKGYIYRGYRTTPHCPRCGTSLSSHEVALGYQDDTADPSVHIKFRITDEALAAAPADLHGLVSSSGKPVYLLAWTTTPWTLPGNTALAVASDAEYAVLSGPDDFLIMAAALVDSVGVPGYERSGTVFGSSLAGLRYEPLYNPHDYGVQRMSMPSFESQSRPEKLSYRVIAADFVSMEDGTGIVHVAPSFGEVDFEAGMREGLDFVQQVDLDGKVTGTYAFAGKFVKAADPEVTEDLRSRGLLFRSGTIRHTYPFCWRCGTPLLYYVKRSWYVKTTAKRDRLVSGNLEINWYPEHIKYGRFGDWLENNVDWAFSRERYWGTPLPVWECPQCGRHECVGGRQDLASRKSVSGYRPDLELHRPYVDGVTFACPDCGATMHRAPEVIDCWFDSGAMTWAQWHYPFENQDLFPRMFPVDYITEAIDQTRGWFYSLHALSTMLFDGPCFMNCACLGHVVDANGEKMSKSKGNMIDPWSVLNEYGADALRWYMLSSVPGENTHRFSLQSLSETMRRHLLTLWNTYSFFVLYANIDGFVPGKEQPAALSELDRWIISELNQLVLDVTKSMEAYSFTQSIRRIEEFIDLLSNWYVRRSRRRFWKSESDDDKLAAHSTLYTCLTTLIRLLAPIAPFMPEEMYQNLVRSVDADAPMSVHLTDYPVADAARIDASLNRHMELVMSLSSLGRAARAKAGIKVRQPLTKAVVVAPDDEERAAVAALCEHMRDELNVKEVEFVAALDSAESGCVVAGDDRYSVGVVTGLSEDLMTEGYARELVRRLQTMRRAAGFEISDHIEVFYETGEVLEGVFNQYADYIRQETLSVRLSRETPPGDSSSQTLKLSGNEIVLGIRRAT